MFKVLKVDTRPIGNGIIVISLFYKNGKISEGIKKILSPSSVCLLFSIVNITNVLKKFIFNYSLLEAIKKPELWFNIAFTIVIIHTIVKFSTDLSYQKREQIIKLLWVKQVLKECNGDLLKAKQLIESKI